MYEELFTVELEFDKNYNGRDKRGGLKTANAYSGMFMTKDVAEKLCDKLKSKFPKAQVVELLRHGRDEMVAQTLIELGEEPAPPKTEEHAGTEQLRKAIAVCLEAMSQIEVLDICTRAVIHG